MTDLTRRHLAAAAPLALLGASTRAIAETPPLGLESAAHYRFALGGFTVTMLLDAAGLIDGPWPIVGEDRPRAEVEELMRENRLPPSALADALQQLEDAHGGRRKRSGRDDGQDEDGFFSTHPLTRERIDAIRNAR